MSTAITTLAGAETALAEQSILSVIASAAANPAVDVDKLERLLAMQERVMAKQAEVTYINALLTAKETLLEREYRIKKNGKIEYKDNKGVVKYAKYEDIADVVQPILYANGLFPAFTYEYTQTPPKVIAVMRLRHKGGHSEEFRSVPLPMIDSSGGKNDVQGAGSIGSYGKRYVLCPALDIIIEGEDDDGMGGAGSVEPLNDLQLGEIKRRITDYQIPESRILKYAKVDSLDEIMQKHYGRLIVEMDRLGAARKK